MAGIKVQVYQGKKWWYVAADFGDGNPPVTKGPMSESDARAMSDELEKEAGAVSGVKLRDRSLEDELANRKVAVAFFALVGCALGFTFIILLAWAAR